MRKREIEKKYDREKARKRRKRNKVYKWERKEVPLLFPLVYFHSMGQKLKFPC